MNRFLRFYLIYCTVNLIEIVVYLVYTRLTIKSYSDQGIKIKAGLIYSFTGFYFGNFISFTSFSYATLANNHLAMLLYFYFTMFIIIYSVILIPFSIRRYLNLGFIFPLIFEIFYVLKNFELYGRKIIFQRNKKLGSNLQLKKALNVSKILIRLDI